MIQFTLKCDKDHRFESWFQSADAYEKLRAAGHVACAVCGSTTVEKALMAPHVQASRKKAKAPERPDAPADTAQAPGPLSRPASPAEAALAEFRRKIESNSEYVGLNFAREARQIHEGTAPERSIYGEARPEEAARLIEDGVPVTPLPFVPGRKSN
ncbi:MAG: DUF1178 family protein [Roseovarius sp.]